MYSYRTIQRKANEAGCTLRKGYQRYLDPAFGVYVTDENGDKISGYEVMDWRLGFTVQVCTTAFTIMLYHLMKLLR